MLATLQKLRTKVVIGFVGGSNLVKQQEQLGVGGMNGKIPQLWQANLRLQTWIASTGNKQYSKTTDADIVISIVIDMFDFCFAENGLTAYKQGVELPSASFIDYIGEERYKKLANFILHYIADMDIPLKRYVTRSYVLLVLPYSCISVEHSSNSAMAWSISRPLVVIARKFSLVRFLVYPVIHSSKESRTKWLWSIW